MTATGLLVVIVNYRTAALVIDCLASLAREADSVPGFRVTVVDNASGDDSDAQIGDAISANGWSGWVTLSVAPDNGGFAAGNNLALRSAFAAENPPAFYWLLNPDTRVKPGAVLEVLSFLADNPAVGIVGTALVEEDGAPWPYAFRFPSALSEFERSARTGPISRLLAHHAVLRRMTASVACVDWVSGASMIVRRGVFDAIGLLDDAYFLYYEETDFCLRAHRAGWDSWYLPRAVVVHITGQSSGLTGPRAVHRRIPSYWFESRRRYFVQNHGRPYAMLADLGWLLGHGFSLARRWTGHRAPPDPPRIVRDFLRHSAFVSS